MKFCRDIQVIFLIASWIVVLCMAQESQQDQKCDYNKRIGIWSTCGKSDVSKAECEGQSCCYVSDSFKEIKNLTQSCAKPPPSFVWKNGTCSKYNGTSCVPFIGNNTLEKKIFFDNRYGVTGTEAINRQFISLAKFSIKDETICRKIVPAAICHQLMPVCDSRGKPLQPCREDCDEIFRVCGQYMDRFFGALELYIKQQKIDFSHLNFPSCTDMKYSKDFDKSKNESCHFIGLFDHSKKPAESKLGDLKKTVIIVVVVAALLTAIATALLVFRQRKIRKMHEEEKKEAAKDTELFTNITTVRDRIREDSAPNPLMAALAQLSPEQKPPQCHLGKVAYVKDLGQGQFGKVFQGRYQMNENEKEKSVAVKMLKEGSSAETKDAFIQEVTLMTVLNHEHILRLIAVSTEEEPFCMVFDFMENGDLNEFLRKNDPENTAQLDKVSLPFGVLVNFASQIASGMEYLAKKKFVHRDLATRNCLVSEDMLIKIADFGMSRDIYESEYYRVGGAAMLPIRWMPPEALLYGRFTVESDIYSYGVLLWELFTYALQPFYGYSNDEVVKFIKKGVVLPRPDICSQVIYDKVMTKCWVQEPENRPSFTEILKRLDGNYDYTESRIPKRQKKASCSEPPETEPANEQTGRVPNRGKSGSLHNYSNLGAFNQESDEANMEAIYENGARENLCFRNSMATDDLYDRPKSYLYADGDGYNATAPMIQPQTSGLDNDDLYSVPRSHDVAEVPDDRQFEEIKKKRYVTSNDVMRLSIKSRSESSPSGNRR